MRSELDKGLSQSDSCLCGMGMTPSPSPSFSFPSPPPAPVLASVSRLGGADMHCSVSGLGDYIADDDRHAIALARDVMAKIDWNSSNRNVIPTLNAHAPAPRYPAEELLGIMPADIKTPVDMREVIARIVDGSDFDEFKPLYGSSLVTGWAELHGYPVGILANARGVLFSEEAQKAAQFIQLDVN